MCIWVAVSLEGVWKSLSAGSKPSKYITNVQRAGRLCKLNRSFAMDRIGIHMLISHLRLFAFIVSVAFRFISPKSEFRFHLCLLRFLECNRIT